MPQRAQKICSEPGCGALCSEARCAKHVSRTPARLHDERRGSAASRGYGRRHEKWRVMVLARDPLCMIQKLCGRGLDRPGEPKHLPAPSTVADHKQRVSRGGDWSMENGQGCCSPCHGWKTREEVKADVATSQR